MTIKLRYVLPLLTAGAAAVIAAMPNAATTNSSAGIITGRSIVCQKSGDAALSIPNLIEVPSAVKGPFVPPYYPWR